jgi:menaquinol-cytochrome c reductase iron-sulfur subunit
MTPKSIDSKSPPDPKRSAPQDGLEDSGDTGERSPRRNFLSGAIAFVTGGLILIVPAASGLFFFLDPISRNGGKSKGKDDGPERRDREGFLRVTTLASLPIDGKPQSFVVYDDVIDAWNKFVDQPIGRVFLRKISDGNVTAFNVRCPHLGCAVDYRSAQNDYFCPCHTSTFNLAGEKLNEIPPRGMDALEVKIKNGTEIWVKFQMYKAGTPDKAPVTA